jgi:hypothetical protein
VGTSPQPAAEPAPATASTKDAAAEPPPSAPFAIVPETIPLKKGPPAGVLWRAFGVCEPDPCWNPFFRDTDLRLHLRSFYFNRHNPDGSINEAWALGGWLQYTSGWLADVFQVGATGYTSQPIHAPEDRDGTSLLEPGQEEITVLGQAFARLRYKDYAVLTAYRQSVNDGYIGPQDNRMIPNTFEGVSVRGEVGKVAYDAGYLWEMKPRNSEEFIPMSEQAGADGSDEGVWYGSVDWGPSDAWEVFAGDYYTPDVFNIFFLQAKHIRELTTCTEAQFGVQFTDERSVGDELIGEFETWNLGVGARHVWDSGWTVGAAFHATGDDANIRSPYGSWPGWLSLIEVDFNRANEKAFGVGVRYDFGKRETGFRVPGLLAVFAVARGFDREDPLTGDSIDDTTEIDLDLTYDVPKVKGLQLRLRQAVWDTGDEDWGYQVRFIVNYEIDLL